MNRWTLTFMGVILLVAIITPLALAGDPTCMKNKDCASGYKCRENVCVSKNSEPGSPEEQPGNEHHSDERHSDERHSDERHSDESQSDESQSDESQSDESQSEEGHSDESQSDESCESNE